MYLFLFISLLAEKKDDQPKLTKWASCLGLSTIDKRFTMLQIPVYLLSVCVAYISGNTQCGDSCVCHSGSDEVTAHCTNIGLTQWPQDLPLDITILDISHNPLTYLQELPVLPHLHRLDARYCELKSVSHNILDQLPELKELELGHNRIVAFPDLNSKGKLLRSLSLDHNQIHALGSGNLKDIHLDQLNLQQNPLSIIHPESFADASIMTISLDWCSIDPKAITDKNSPFKHLSNSLKHLFWSHNSAGLQHLPQDIFTGLHLDHLQLTHNSLSNAMFLESNVTVKDLDLSHNIMSELDILGCCSNTVSAKFTNCSIYRLNNKNNHIKILAQNSASSSLEVLDLAFNKITYISFSVLRGMSNLKEINLEGNPLSKLSYGVRFTLQFVDLEIVTVTNTPISCDCRNEVLNYLHTSGITLKGMHCETDHNPTSDLRSSLCFKPEHVTIHKNASKKAFSCFAKGIPQPTLEWTCDGQQLDVWGNDDVTDVHGNMSTKILYVTDIDQGCSVLSCTAKNLKGFETVAISLAEHTPAVGNSSTTREGNISKLLVLIIAISCAVLLVTGVAILCIFRGKLYKKCDKYYVRHNNTCSELSSEQCQSHMLISS